MTRSVKSEENRNALPPWNVDRFVSEDNTPDREEPTDLEELKVRSPRYITALKGATAPRLEQIDENGTWVLELGDDFMMGRPGSTMEKLPKAQVKRETYAEIKPGIPKWSGITYHPKVSSPREQHRLTRISGRKVIPHGFIFGQDNRQVYYPSGYPWRCIGKVEVWFIIGNTWFFYGAGTGALVGENVMVTASHMFPWSLSSIGFGWAMKFTPAYYDGNSTSGSGVYSWCEKGHGYSDHDQGDDLIVMKLFTPLGKSLGWFGSKTYNDDWEDENYWTKCGYPADVASGQRPSRITWFPIVDDDWDGAGLELEYKADASGGDSGGPVFGWWDDGPYLVGVHSGWEEEYHFLASIEKNNVAAGGSILPDLINWAHSHW